MSPAEQLIRDYLGRLAAAARGQLSPDDRRALVNRTRDFIERKTNVGRPPTAVEVARLLSGLGDPTGLVSQERQRLATLRGDEPKPASRGRLARMLRGDSSRIRGASWHWPVQEGSRADLKLTLLDASSPVTPNGASANGTGGRKSAGPVIGDVNGDPRNAAPAVHDTDGTAALAPAPPAEVAVEGDVDANDDVADIFTTQPAKPVPAGTVPASTVPASTVPANTVPANTVPIGIGSLTWSTAAPAKRSRAAVALIRLASWARSNKVEAAAVVLLGLGGAIFPPVWLLGAVVALASRLWDLLDKWLGLAGPLLLTVISLAVGIAVAGSRGSLGMHVHEAWVFADLTSRVTALLGAGYLAWRSAHGRRPPATPPWSKPHKIG
jgi:hypothetical protein